MREYKETRKILAIVAVTVLLLIVSQGSITGQAYGWEGLAKEAYCADYDGDAPLEPSIVKFRTTGASQVAYDRCSNGLLVELICDKHELKEKLYSCTDSVCTYADNGAAYCG